MRTIIGESIICLYTDNIGWEEFSISDTKALSERNITIGNNIEVGEDVLIGNNVFIGDNVKLERGIHIGNQVYIGSNVKIACGTVIREGVNVPTNTEIGNDIIISGCQKIKQIVINGSADKLLYYGIENFHIGCRVFNVKNPMKFFKFIGKKHNYSKNQIREYLTYIKFIKRVHKNKIQL